MFDYNKISQAVFTGDADEAIRLTKYAIAQGYPAEYVFEKGLITGIDMVAEKYRDRNVLVPEVLLSARAMRAGSSIVKNYLKMSNLRNKVSIVIGTVEGDVHDIGKNLVKTMALILGINVIDLGVNVSAKKFIKEIKTQKPDFLMLSCLLTTTICKIQEVIEELKVNGLRDELKIVIGGAPVTRDFCKKVGADYYFPDAISFKLFFEQNLEKIIK